MYLAVLSLGGWSVSSNITDIKRRKRCFPVNSYEFFSLKFPSKFFFLFFFLSISGGALSRKVRSRTPPLSLEKHRIDVLLCSEHIFSCSRGSWRVNTHTHTLTPMSNMASSPRDLETQLRRELASTRQTTAAMQRGLNDSRNRPKSISPIEGVDQTVLSRLSNELALAWVLGTHLSHVRFPFFFPLSPPPFLFFFPHL